MMLKKKQCVAGGVVKQFQKSVIAVGNWHLFAGAAVVDFTYVRCVCMKMFGECPVMA
jgi:hypothetical protein